MDIIGLDVHKLFDIQLGLFLDLLLCFPVVLIVGQIFAAKRHFDQISLALESSVDVLVNEPSVISITVEFVSLYSFPLFQQDLSVVAGKELCGWHLFVSLFDRTPLGLREHIMGQIYNL